MAEGPHIREIGRVAGSHGGTVIIGVDHDTVTLQTDGVALSPYGAEELGRLLVSASWQTGWYQGRDYGAYHGTGDGEP